MIPNFYILIVLAVCASVFIREVWGECLGKNCGVLAVSLAIYILLGRWLIPSGVWIFVTPVVLFFAGLSGFLKNTPLSISATIITTIFLVAPLLQSPPGPPPKSPPLQALVYPSGQKLPLLPPLPPVPVYPVFTEFPPMLIFGVPYLLAIAGIISSVIQNHYRSRSPHADPTKLKAKS